MQCYCTLQSTDDRPLPIYFCPQVAGCYPANLLTNPRSLIRILRIDHGLQSRCNMTAAIFIGQLPPSAPRIEGGNLSMIAALHFQHATQILPVPFRSKPATDAACTPEPYRAHPFPPAACPSFSGPVTIYFGPPSGLSFANSPPSLFQQEKSFIQLFNSSIEFRQSLVQGKFISPFPLNMKGFIAVVAIGLIACVHGQDVCADAIAKVPECAVSHGSKYSCNRPSFSDVI